MRILIYNPGGEVVAPLQRMLEQSAISSLVADSAEQCSFLAMTDLYAALLYLRNEPFDHLSRFFSDWKSEGVSTPCIVLSKKQSALERAQALEMGVDAYFIAPYTYSQLLLTLNSKAYQRELKERQTYQTNHFELDVISRVARFAGEHLPLTKTEFEFLSLLLRRKGNVVSRVQIWEEVWGHREYPLANTVDVHMNRLRRKLGVGAIYLQTVYGIGYRMTDHS